MTKQLPIRIAALYHFTRFPDPHALKPALLELCEAVGVKGTVLLANEGINGTIAGSDEAVEAVLEHIRALPGCAALEFKESRAETMPFLRLKVRIKREIVTMGFEVGGQADLDFVDGVGTYVDPHDWNALIADPDTIVIDTRNDYEVGIGTFKGAIDPATESFSEFPEWFRGKRSELEGSAGTPKVAPKIAMFCTGGIRCEKATAFLKAEGVEEVFHLKGGILKYLENVPAEESQWEGECFVFDERVSVKHGLEQGDYSLCRACRMPLTPQQLDSEHFVEGVACEYCHASRTDEQRARYAERNKQSALSRERGEPHVGAKMPEHKGARFKDGFDSALPNGYPGFEGKFRD